MVDTAAEAVRAVAIAATNEHGTSEQLNCEPTHRVGSFHRFWQIFLAFPSRLHPRTGNRSKPYQKTRGKIQRYTLSAWIVYQSKVSEPDA